MNQIFLQFLLGIMFLTIIFLHLSRKNFLASIAYSLQSLIIMLFFLNSFFETNNLTILLVVFLVLIVKVILAPLFFIRLIKKNALAFSVSTYLNTPLTIISIAILTFIAHYQKFSPLTSIVPANQDSLSLALSAMFLSLFLIINRKGALSQILGVLSLENSIVAFVIFAGLEQNPALQIGIMFNIGIWILIATIFMSMILKHFGTLNVSSMNNLKD